MINFKTHPIQVVREKNSTEFFSNKYDFKFSNMVEAIKSNCVEFNNFCNDKISALKRLDLKSQDDIKYKSYLLTKMRKHNISLKLREPNDSNHFGWKIKKEYDYFYHKNKNILKKLNYWYNYILFNNTNDLINSFHHNRDIFNSSFLTNKEVTEKIPEKIYIFNEQKNKTKKKQYSFLVNILTRSSVKTSPLLNFNSVKFCSDSIPAFDYRLLKNKYTPNYVFFIKSFLNKALGGQSIDNLSFIINKRISKDGKYIFVFSNSSSNFKVLNSKDTLVRFEYNEIIDNLLNSNEPCWSVSKFSIFFGISLLKSRKIILNLYKYGVLIPLTNIKLNSSFGESLINSIRNNKIDDSFREKVIEIDHLFEILNTGGFSKDIVEKIQQLYKEVAIDSNTNEIPKSLCIYGDNIVRTDNDVFSLSNDIKEELLELLQSFAIFDVNELIKNEFILMSNIKDNKIYTSDSKFTQIITEASLKYSEFWTDPWKNFSSKSNTNKKILHLKEEFKQYLERHSIDKDIDLVEIIRRVSSKIDRSSVSSAACFSLFFQKSNIGQIVINKVYPGYGSFYKRFIRNTNILDLYKSEINDFYQNSGFEYMDINESLGFNGNVTDYAMFPNIYINANGNVNEFIDSYIGNKHTVNGLNRNRITKSGGDLFITAENEQLKYKPVIASSLIRALYPGNLAFLSAIFTNINFIPEISPLIFNGQKKDVKYCPNIVFKDILIERKSWMIESIPSYVFDNDNIKTYLRMLELFKTEGIPKRFFFKVRKKEFKGKRIKSISIEFEKPLFCDFDNIVLWKEFCRILKRREEIIISICDPKNLNLPEYMQEVLIYDS
ncbi:hypothetical protein HU830_03195 [Lactobacillus sp. DCY120]|uniref:Lantibiotic dehydratase N-terminal domain-containing protein n=1 Tax=Bombilactobacillus apium TaxID=2675299 RepID=A0A850R6C0_9LACO|nr:hypothetical protein [Bombilactobacillus apium]NVY96182.1 hypothetical protein [Bombilactobacillus apium]